MPQKVSLIYGVAVTLLSCIFGKYWYLFVGFLVFNVIDYVTGLVWAKFFAKTVSSSVGARGIAKKVSYWVVIGIAFYVSYSFVQLGELIGINLHFTILFGWFTLATYMINELRSILENLIKMDIKVPGFLVKGLDIAEKMTNAKTENIINKEETEESE